MKCIHCSSDMRPYFTKKTFDIHRCPQCRLLSVENVPDDLSVYYTEGYFTGDVSLDGYMDYESDKEVTKKTYADFLDVLKKHTPNDNVSMFEVGCATGFFMNMGAEIGWNVEGIDISSYAILKAKEKKLAAQVGTLETYEPKQQFDVVVMQDVIEHVKDPIDTMRRAISLLKNGGIIALSTPDAGSMWAKTLGRYWHAFVPPQHLFYYNTSNLSSMLEKHGVSVVHTAHYGKSFALPYIIRLLHSWTGLTLFSRLATWISKQPRLKHIALRINVGDTLYIIAKKQG